MPRRFVNQLGHQEAVDQIFLASQKQLRPNRNGNLYLQVELSDRTGSISARMWNASESDYRNFDDGDFVRIEGSTQLYQGGLQLIAVNICKARYEEVDPGNRLVAGELEARWEQALGRRAQLQRESAEQENRQPPAVSQRDRQLVRELSSDLERVWNAPTTSMEDRKMLLRFLVRRVHLDGVTEPGKIRIEVEWHTGAHSSVVIDRPLVGVWAPKTSQPVLDRIGGLVADHDYTAIAEMLNREGLRSAKGLSFTASTVAYIARTRGWGRRG